MVTLNAIRFSVVAGNRMPQCAERRLRALAKGNINVFLTSSDSVNVQSIEDMNCPQLHGRVIDVAQSRDKVPSSKSLHTFAPSLHFRRDKNKFLKI